MKKLLYYSIRFILSTMLILIINGMGGIFSNIVPVNLLTILITTFFGIPGLIGLLIFRTLKYY